MEGDLSYRQCMKVREMIQELKRYDPEGRIFVDFPPYTMGMIPSLIDPVNDKDVRITCSLQG